MIEQQQRPAEDGAPKSRRELREERRLRRRRERWTRGLSALRLDGIAGPVARRIRGLKGKKERVPDGVAPLEDHEAPKSRRELRRSRQRKELRGGAGELVFTVIVAFVVVFGFIRPFVVQAYKIPSESMVPTFLVGDRLLANKFIYYFREPERGDIVLFDGVEGEEEETLIKRVVGVAGDRIRVRKGDLYVNGELQDEPYLNEESLPRSFRNDYGPERVPEGDVFVMGDNRGNSADSRVFGPVPVDDIEGEAFWRFWPITRIGPV